MAETQDEPKRDTWRPASRPAPKAVLKRAGFMEAYRTMQEHLVDAGCSLLTGVSADVVEVVDGTSLDFSTEKVVSMIGYAAEACRGAVVLVATPAFLRSTQRASHSSIAELADMQGELANMLLGRLKLTLLKHGVTFGVTTPTSVVGVDVLLPAPKGGTSTWLRFACEQGDLHVRFDVIFDAAFVLLAEAEAPRDGDAAEGDVLVF